MEVVKPIIVSRLRWYVIPLFAMALFCLVIIAVDLATGADLLSSLWNARRGGRFIGWLLAAPIAAVGILWYIRRVKVYPDRIEVKYPLHKSWNSVISIKDFKESKSVETLANPYGICKANGRLYISAYGADYSNPVGVYDIKTNKTRTIGNAGRVLASGDRLYMTTSTSPDWVNYVTTFSVYNAITGSVEEWKLKNAPEEMTSGTAIPYFMEIDPIDGCMYIGYTDYHSNGRIYRFNASDSYKGMFTVDALNPNGMVFLIDR